MVRLKWAVIGLIIIGLGAAQGNALACTAPATRLFAEPWIDANHGVEPEMQWQWVDADTVVIRQSIATNFEGPFLFLFFGQNRALLVDSGAGGLKVKPTIDMLMTQWESVHHHEKLALVVAHTHSHADHIAGDAEFEEKPATTVVGHSPEDVARFFGIATWPSQSVTFDLGNRVLDITPIPGEEPSEIAFFDRQTKILLMGDALYPGRLYCMADDFDAYRRSIDRIVGVTKGKGVRWVLGDHIEMTTTPGRDYPMHATSHPREHRLELSWNHLIELQTALNRMGDRPMLDQHDDFIFYPVP